MLKLINRIDKSTGIINNSIDSKIKRAVDFSKVLESVKEKNELKISAHAMDRLRERSINLSEKDLKTISSAVEKIKSKGGKEALIYYNNIAFITSIKNNTIITAVDDKNLKENVFTNIDSAIIL